MTIYPFLPQTVQLGPLKFYTYGLIIGLALILGIWLVEKQAKKTKVTTTPFWQMMVGGLILALIGARLWHLATDWQLYVDHLTNIFNLTTGGLSILGAVLGWIVGVVAVGSWQKRTQRPTISFKLALDLSVFGLPLAQALGRLGNFANQELYGGPFPIDQTLIAERFWGLRLYVDRDFRLLGYERYPYYHPLFLYESIGLLTIAGLIYWLDKKQTNFFKLGKGRLFLVYLASYSWLRFFLEFIRLQKTTVIWSPLSWLGVNQLVLFLVGATSLIWLLILGYQQLKTKG